MKNVVYQNIVKSLNKLIAKALDENLNERLEKMGDCFCTTSAYDIVNLLKNKPKEYRILYDAKIGYYLIGEAEHFIHHQLMEKAFDDGLYYPVKDFMQNMCGGFDKYSLYSYQDLGIDGYYDGEGDENFDPFLYYIVFSPNEEWELGTDGYNKRYDYPFGHVFTRGCDLSEIDLWDALGVPENSEKLNESADNLNDAFWKWFAGSKVVDKQGNPLMVYHGSSKAGLTTLDPKRGSNIDAIYFSDNISVAEHWSGDFVSNSKVSVNTDSIEELLNILNSFKNKSSKVSIITKDTEYGKEYWLDSPDGSTIERLGCKIDNEHYINKQFNREKNLKDILKNEIEFYTDNIKDSKNYACYLSIQNPLIIDAKKKAYWKIEFNGQEMNTESIAVYAKENGYDGAIIKNVLETDYENKLCNDYIVFNANQIKSVDNNGNWSNSDNIYETLNKEIERYL